MRKSTLLFVAASLISLGVLAVSEEGKTSRQPAAGKETPACSLTQVYFSIFSFFIDTPVQQTCPDTIRITVSMPRIKENTRKTR
ncbi:MAG: hypothetical protein ACK5XQ_13880 [Flavobacteriales bacterium]